MCICMSDVKNILDFFILILKCVLIILMLGIILPHLLDLLIKVFMIKNKYCKDSILVFNILNENKLILLRFINVVNEFFTI